MQIVGMALCAATAHAVELHGQIHIRQTTLPCNGQTYSRTWTNDSADTLYLTGGKVFHGAGRGIKADIGTQTYITKAPGAMPQLLFVTMADRYADPSGVDDTFANIDLGGHYFVLEPGGTLVMQAGCSLVGHQDGPAMDLGGGYFVHPFDYFWNIQGFHPQAFLYVSLTKPA